MAADPLLDVAAIAEWSRETGIAALLATRWGWPVTESLHFIGLCLLFGTVALFDLRMLGMARGIPLRALHRMIPFGLLGFALSLASGSLFFLSAPDQYLYNPAFQTKLALMLLAGINMLCFYAIAARAAWRSDADGVPAWPARLCGAVSLACWLGVITCGRVITAYRPPSHWCFWC